MIKVDKTTCIGCGACVAIDQEHFGFDGDGLSDVISSEPATDATREAASACPVEAISIESTNEAINITEIESETEDIAA